MRERERERERENGWKEIQTARGLFVWKRGMLDMVIGASHVRFISGLLSFFHLSSSIRLLTLPGLSLSLISLSSLSLSLSLHTFSLLIIISITFKYLHFETQIHMYTFSRLDNTVL